MKRIFAALFFVFLLAGAGAIDYRPSSISEMDVTITSTAAGKFTGEISKGDSAEILYISMENFPEQQLISLEEHMVFGGKKILPSHVKLNGIEYAKYRVENAKEFEGKEFTITRKARVKKTAKIIDLQDYNLTIGITEHREYTLPTGFVESNDAELIGKAGVEFKSESAIETIREITEWVNNNIEYDFENYYSVVAGAKETYRNRKGVCDEYANLTAAFLRIKGIPTRYVSGISYDGERFGNHGWVEAYIPKTGWVGIDSTYGEAGYLDAAHIAITKVKDVNEAVDFITTTKSKNQISVDAELSMPQVEINEIKTFKSLFEAELEIPKTIKSGESFEVTALITNNTGKNAMFPIELLVHKDFSIGQPKKIVLFKKEEEQKISWQLNAPEQNNGKKYSYQTMLLLPDQNKTTNITVEPGKAGENTGKGFTVKDVSPYIKGEDLVVEATIQNNGGKKIELTISLSKENNETNSETIFLEALEEQKISITTKANPGNYELAISSGEEENRTLINVPETKEEPIVKEPQNNENQGKPEAPLNPENTENGWILVLGALGGLGVAAALLLVSLRK